MDIRQVRAELSLRLRRVSVRLGLFGLVAAALVVLALTELASVTLPAGNDAKDLAEQVRRQRESPRSGREIKRNEENNPTVQIAAFERFFPAATQINVVLRDIHSAAERETLVLERGEYRLVEEAGLDLLRYQITLPVKGSYSSITAFVRRLLRDIPSLALDGITLQRQNAGEASVEAQIRVSIFYQGAR